MSVRIQPYSSSFLTPAAPADSTHFTSSPSKAERVYRLTLGREKAEAAIYRLFSASVSSLQDTISDVSGVLRFITSEFPSLASDPALSIAGITTAFSMGTGANMAIINIQKAFKSLEIEDYKGLADQILNGAGGVAQATAGTVYLGVRVASVASSILSTNAAAASAATILSLIGNAFFAILYAVFATAAGFELYQGGKLRGKLRAQGDSKAQLNYLQNRMEVTGGNALSHLAKKWKEASLARLIDDSGLSETELQNLRAEARKVTGGAGEKEVFIECLKEAALKKHLENKAVAQLVKEFKGLRKPAEDLETFVRKLYSVEDLTRIGLDQEINKMQKRREAKLSRLVGEIGMQKIKECDLSNPTKVEAVMNEVQGEMDSKRNFNIALAVASLIGTGAMIACCILTTGVAAIVVTGVFIAIALSFIGIDGYLLHQALKNSEPHANDKKLLWISSVASLVMMGVAFAITTAFSFGVIPLVVAGVVGLVWLGITLSVIYHSHTKIKDPELEKLRELLAKSGVEDQGKKILEAFGALPAEKFNTLFQFLATEMPSDVEKGKEYTEMAKHLDLDKYHAFLEQLKKQQDNEREAKRLQELENLYGSVMRNAPA